MKTFTSVDEYIASFAEDVRPKLIELRHLAQELIPDAIETISYGMPTYKRKRNLVHFACYKNHIGLYPGPSVIQKFSSEFTTYKWSKGAVQFPIEKELPISLIRRMVEATVKEYKDR